MRFASRPTVTIGKSSPIDSICSRPGGADVIATGVALGGIGVALGGIGVALGGIGVALGGIGVALGGIGVALGGIGVALGGIGVVIGTKESAVGAKAGWFVPHAVMNNNSGRTNRYKRIQFS
jgi:hypothetical protein